MGDRRKSLVRRSQKDYPLGFKLSFVEQIEQSDPSSEYFQLLCAKAQARKAKRAEDTRLRLLFISPFYYWKVVNFLSFSITFYLLLPAWTGKQHKVVE